jgi:hypothetical protein
MPTLLYGDLGIGIVQFCSGIFSNFLSLKPCIESQISDPDSNPVFGSGFHSGTKTFISVQ